MHGGVSVRTPPENKVFGQKGNDLALLTEKVTSTLKSSENAFKAWHALKAF